MSEVQVGASNAARVRALRRQDQMGREEAYELQRLISLASPESARRYRVSRYQANQDAATPIAVKPRTPEQAEARRAYDAARTRVRRAALSAALRSMPPRGE